MHPIQENISLRPFNTFNIDVSARYFTSVGTLSEVKELVRSDVYKTSKRIILGGGSNVLFLGDYNGLVIKNDIKGIDIVDETEDLITLKVGAGEIWHDLVMYCVNNNWGGVENLSLIPGTVGAAPMQNIGAYGVEIKEVVKNVEGLNLVTGAVESFNNEQCEFGYRESVFKQKLKEKIFISSVTLTLTKKNHQLNTSYGAIQTVLTQQNVEQLSVKSISNAVITIRQQKLPDPKKIGNAGSFFKNPTIGLKQYEQLKLSYPTIPGYQIGNQHVKLPAAWLIEQCGWKGKTFNNIGVHAHQALVLVNYGDGSGEKIWNLAQQILSSVNEKFHVQLQPEVNVIL